MTAANERTTRRPSRTIALVLVVAVASSVVSWQLARRTESPTQVAARAEPPEPVPVTAALRRGVLEPPTSLQATVGRAQETAIEIGEHPGGIVTAGGVEVGAEIRAGDMLLRIDGRPVLVLPGPFPLYRDLSGGETGDDVIALQNGLAAAGIHVTDEPGTYGSSTKAALEQLYQRAGEDAPTGDAEIHGELTAIKTERAMAEMAEEAPPKSAAEREQQLRQSLGVDLLRTEIIMVPDLPATVDDVATVGQRVSGEEPIAKFGSGPVVLHAEVPASAAERLDAGTVGSVDTPDGEAEVTVLGTRASEDPETVEIVMVVEGSRESGATVLVRFTESGGSEQLLAPAAAIVTRSGSSFVYVSRSDRFEEVEVKVLGVSGGTAAIETLRDDPDLDAGVMVRVAG